MASKAKRSKTKGKAAQPQQSFRAFRFNVIRPENDSAELEEDSMVEGGEEEEGATQASPESPETGTGSGTTAVKTFQDKMAF